MTNEELSTLINEAKCYGCFGASLADQIRLGLLDRIASTLESTKQVLDSGVMPFGGAATVTIPSTYASAARCIQVSYLMDGPDVLTLGITNIVPGVSFDVTTGGIVSTGSVCWSITEV